MVSENKKGLLQDQLLEKCGKILRKADYDRVADRLKGVEPPALEHDKPDEEKEDSDGNEKLENSADEAEENEENSDEEYPSTLPNFANLIPEDEEIFRDIVKNILAIQETETEKIDYRKELGDVETCPFQTSAMRALIFNLYKVVYQSICRNTLMKIMDVAGKKLSEATSSLLQQKELKTRLDDLIHNENMVRLH